MTLCRLRVVQANSHSISIPHLVVFVKDLSYFEGVVYLVRRYAILRGCCVARGGTNGFLQSKNKGTKCRDDTLSEPTRNATEPRGQQATPCPQWSQSPP